MVHGGCCMHGRHDVGAKRELRDQGDGGVHTIRPRDSLIANARSEIFYNRHYRWPRLLP